MFVFYFILIFSQTWDFITLVYSKDITFYVHSAQNFQDFHDLVRPSCDRISDFKVLAMHWSMFSVYCLRESKEVLSFH